MVQSKINLIMLGDAAIGKTSLLRKVDKREFVPSHLKTIAVDYILTEYYNEEDDKKVQVKIWDTAGQEKFRHITYQFYRQADGIILGFDLTNEKTYKSISNWVQSIYKVKDQDTPVVIVGNKVDLEEQRVVTQDQARSIAQQHGMNFHETSAMTGVGVDDMLKDVLTQVYTQKIRPQAQESAGAGTAASTSAIDRPSFTIGQK